MSGAATSLDSSPCRAVALVFDDELPVSATFEQPLQLPPALIGRAASSSMSATQSFIGMCIANIEQDQTSTTFHYNAASSHSMKAFCAHSIITSYQAWMTT